MKQMREDIQAAFKKSGIIDDTLSSDFYERATQWVAMGYGDETIKVLCFHVGRSEVLGQKQQDLREDCIKAVNKCRTACKQAEAKTK